MALKTYPVLVPSLRFRDTTTTYCDTNRVTHKLGLLSFSSNPNVHTIPTKNFDIFEDTIDDMQAGGMTAIYTAIHEACIILEREAKLYPEADLRVLLLSDGISNSGVIEPQRAYDDLIKIGATCDALIIGDPQKVGCVFFPMSDNKLFPPDGFNSHPRMYYP